MNKLVYSIKDVCEFLGVSHCTIYSEINAGNLKSIKIQSRRVITQDQLQQYLKQKEEQAEIKSH